MDDLLLSGRRRKAPCSPYAILEYFNTGSGCALWHALAPGSVMNTTCPCSHPSFYFLMQAPHGPSLVEDWPITAKASRVSSSDETLSQRCMRRGGGGGSRTQNFVYQKLAQINFSFSDFSFFPTVKSESGGGVQRGGTPNSSYSCQPFFYSPALGHMVPSSQAAMRPRSLGPALHLQWPLPWVEGLVARPCVCFCAPKA